MRFWDSSALVPLLVVQPVSPEVRRWWAEDRAMALWSLTAVEVVSALQRLRREHAVTERQALLAEGRLDELLRPCHVVVEIEAVKQRARRLLRTHALRAADALQLAAALQWAASGPAGRTLYTFDARLGLAARREGFAVLPDPAEQ
ncbi:MAG: type II toxin-antitoxin system VapC family toxin [Deltaproteobacteria bacterium]|nr:type II toxin-antitoxin system VapC family toxin [Deltaproteobacteria bacterium]